MCSLSFKHSFVEVSLDPCAAASREMLRLDPMAGPCAAPRTSSVAGVPCWIPLKFASTVSFGVAQIYLPTTNGDE